MDAVVFVVDSTSKDANEDTKEYLYDLIKEGLEGVPLLVMANKQDELNPRSKEVITEELGLTEITDREWSKLIDDQIHLIFTLLCVKRRKKTYFTKLVKKLFNQTSFALSNKQSSN